MIINNSRAATYLDCPRKYYWQYEHGGHGIVRNEVTEALAFGTIIHHLLALYYGEQDWRGGLGDALRAGVPNYDDLAYFEKAKWDENLDWAERMIREYVKWAQQNDRFSVLQLETEGSLVLGTVCHNCGEDYHDGPGDESCGHCDAPIHRLVYKVDMEVQQDGYTFPIDHKTTSGIGDAFLASWQYSPQMLLYTKGMRENYPDTNRYQMNFLRKAKQVGQIKEKQCPDCRNGSKKKLSCEGCHQTGKVAVPAVDPPPFHREPPIRFREEFLDRVEISRIKACNSILEDRAEPDPLERWEMKPDKCFARGRCPYVDLCWNVSSPEKWQEPAEDLLDGYLPRPKDYVTLAREEQI